MVIERELRLYTHSEQPADQQRERQDRGAGQFRNAGAGARRSGCLGGLERPRESVDWDRRTRWARPPATGLREGGSGRRWQALGVRRAVAPPGNPRPTGRPRERGHVRSSLQRAPEGRGFPFPALPAFAAESGSPPAALEASPHSSVPSPGCSGDRRVQRVRGPPHPNCRGGAGGGRRKKRKVWRRRGGRQKKERPKTRRKWARGSRGGASGEQGADAERAPRLPKASPAAPPGRAAPPTPRPAQAGAWHRREVAEFLELTAEPEGSRPRWARSGAQARPRDRVRICGPPTGAGLLRLRHTPPLWAWTPQ
ncbi:collagen alpha-1(I) chain-like [Cebus imitator]|uniref:collagen alpha-1(I) chain-like n=1 Tax=Cebus imitator TaxID=2715852 RepID=UPI00189A37A5|nr:collagen alpha-1(I) chain-like [Cebus imitator]